MQWLGIKQDLSRHFKTEFTERLSPAPGVWLTYTFVFSALLKSSCSVSKVSFVLVLLYVTCKEKHSGVYNDESMPNTCTSNGNKQSTREILNKISFGKSILCQSNILMLGIVHLIYGSYWLYKNQCLLWFHYFLLASIFMETVKITVSRIHLFVTNDPINAIYMYMFFKIVLQWTSTVISWVTTPKKKSSIIGIQQKLMKPQ